jgi:excisionase family DNA binding protein
MNNHETHTHTSRLLTISEAAWILGVSKARVCRAIRLGLLPVVRRRGRVLIPAGALAHLSTRGDSAADHPDVAGPTGRGDA